MNAASTKLPKSMQPMRFDYEQGMSLRALRRKYLLSDSEARDICPEEFDDEQHATPEGLGGY